MHASTEDRVAALAHAGGVCKFIPKAECEQCADEAHELAESRAVHAAIDRAGLIPNADDHGVSAAVAVGLFVQGGKNFCVVGTQVFSFDELRSQGRFSGCDVGELAYVLKYVRKALVG